MPDLSLGWDETLLRLAVAAGLAGLIGIEREIDEKAAGLRTHMLVALGSALFTLVSAYGFAGILSHSGSQVLVRLDPSRIAAQIVTGIGFIGAGVIFRQGFTVRGLTTAASLWVVAAIGMAAGAGYWAGAVLATAVGLVSLRGLEWVKERALPRRALDVIVVELKAGGTSGEVLDALERSASVVAVRRDGRRVEAELRIERTRRTRLLDELSALSGVEEARWVR